MDFDSILYIILIVGSILWSVVKTFKKEEAERQVKKNRSGRPIIVEEADVQEEEQPQRRARVAPQTGQNNEYFSYETMSERDFEQTFAHNAEEANEHTVKETENPRVALSMDEEEVYKGVIWSEILKLKY